MKKTFAKRGLQALVTMFLLVGGLMFVSNSASAQSVSTSFNVDGVTWVSEDEALGILQNRIQLIHNQLSGFIVGTPSWNEGMRRALFFKGVYREVSEGTAVPAAVVLNHTRFGNANMANQDDDQSVRFTPQQAQQIAEEAVSLLRTN